MNKSFMENFVSTNPKMRYFCNKTLSLRHTLTEILDELHAVEKQALCYVYQDPKSLDHTLLSTVLNLIGKTANLIDWKNLNHKCFWEDFRREVEQLRNMIAKCRIAGFNCLHAVIDKISRAREVLQDVVDTSKLEPVWEKSHAQVPADDLPPHSLRFACEEPNEELSITWTALDDEDTLNQISISRENDCFLLRFFRYLTNYARRSLELILYTMCRTDDIFRSQFPVETLALCNNLTASELLPHERTLLQTSKLRFDLICVNIAATVVKFRDQLDSLEIQRSMLKHLLKDPSYPVRVCSCPNKAFPKTPRGPFCIVGRSIDLHTRCLKDSRHLKFMSTDIVDPHLFNLAVESLGGSKSQDSDNFTLQTDRANDMIETISDIWNISAPSRRKHQTIETTVLLTFTALDSTSQLFSNTERQSFKDALYDIFRRRKELKRNACKLLDLFNKDVFTDVHATGSEESDFDNTDVDDMKTSSSEASWPNKLLHEGDAEVEATPSVQLSGGFDVSIGKKREIVVQNHLKAVRAFHNLESKEQVILTQKMMSKLSNLIISETLFSKTLLEKGRQTKAFLKCLKQKDRSSSKLKVAVTTGQKYADGMLTIAKKLKVFNLDGTI